MIARKLLNCTALARAACAFGSSLRTDVQGALFDLVDGVRGWRVWHLIGSSELRRRYARSRFGQLWLTLTTGVTVGALGFVWSLLWKMPPGEMIPFIGTNIVMWAFLTSFIGDATAAFIGTGHYFLNQRMPVSTAIFAMIWRNLLILVHNAVIIIALLLVFRIPIGWHSLAVIPAVALVVIIGIPIAHLVGFIATRFRDVAQLIPSLLQILFFISPMMWKPAQLPPEHRWIVDWNPFATMLTLLRAPLLGEPMQSGMWGAAVIMAFVAWGIALPLMGRFKDRVIYWI